MNTRVVIKSLLKRISLIFITLSALAAGTFAQALLVSDAHTSATSVNGNFGASPALTVSSNNTGYVRFNISHLLPAGTKAEDVAKANVKFYVSKVAAAGKLDVYPILGDWDEKTITANNAPPIGPLAQTTQQIGRDAQGNYLLIDVTDLVKQWLGDGTGQNALPNYGFALLPHPVDADTQQLADINFDSKENSQTSHDGMLSIQLESGPTGLQMVAHDATLIGDGTAANPLGVAPGAISTTYLSDNAVTADKIANGAVTPDKIIDGAVLTSKIADNAVGTTKLADGSVTSAKITAPLSLTGASPNFTLSVANTGTGPALTALGAINTSTQYNIGGTRILSNPGTANLFAGVSAGSINTTGTFNAFFGHGAGATNTDGSNNSFFGTSAGLNNSQGFHNAFFGSTAGLRNSTGSDNSFFGRGAGEQNTTGSFNSFFGEGAGVNNMTGNNNSSFGRAAGFALTTGYGNSFFGAGAGDRTTTGLENSFFGQSAGTHNQSGTGNTFVGKFADFTFNSLNTTGNNNTLLGSQSQVQTNISNATAIGSRTLVTQDNSLVLGGISGVNGGTDTNVGIGNTAPKAKLHVTNGKIYIEANGQGLILKSPSGSCFELKVADDGTLMIAGVACP